MGIGGQLLLLLAIPLTALLLVTGYGVRSGATQAQAASELTERTDVALAAYALVEDLQAERSELIRNDATTRPMRLEVESSQAALEQAAARAGGDLETRTNDALRRVGAASSVAGRDLGGAVALRVYSSAVGDLLDLGTVAIDPRGAIDDAAASTTDYLARAQAAAAEERDLVTVLYDQASLDAQSFQEVMALASAQQSYIALAAASAPTERAIQIREVGFASAAADTLRRATFSGTDDRTAAWIEGLSSRTSELATFQRAAERGAVAAVDALARDSRLLFVTAALSAIAIALISALLLRRAIRSIARPLQELSVQAEDVARTRLPDAVAAQQQEGAEQVHLPALRANGAAEVHEVAQAFNDVQDTALRLASEQAALRRNQAEALTNLGRRNQTLLARQLDFISSLETRETDPVFLDHLFKLDHLASRMRRNAESLLILAGSETPRRRRKPAAIPEIVRAAMSEVEEFERVRIGNMRDATIVGPAVIDLIHLLSELIENSLAFSPPDTTVEIDGRSLGQGGYQFAIIDHGVGMSDVELVAANHRLRGQDELRGMPTRYLGQYVVAKLASKTGAHVRLQPTAGGRGVTALVILPTSALIGEIDRNAVAAPLPGSRAARESGPVPFAPGTAVEPVADAATLAEFGTFPAESVEPTPVESIAYEAESVEPTPVESTPVESTPVESTPVEPTPVEPIADEAAPVVSPRDEVPRWFAETRQQDPGIDPWDAFQSEAADAERPALSEPPPPPSPTSVPEQPGWSPEAVPISADAVAPAVVPGEASRSGGDDETRSGGLTRRVPGASLADSRSGEVVGQAAPAPGRSADGVRSMLASLQAGRGRGRTDPESGDGQPTAGSTSTTTDADGAPVHTDTVHDGRFPQ